jgi:hypothetical protein
MALIPSCQYNGFLAGDPIGSEYHIAIVPSQGVTLRRNIGKGYP